MREATRFTRFNMMGWVLRISIILSVRLSLMVLLRSPMFIAIDGAAHITYYSCSFVPQKLYQR